MRKMKWGLLCALLAVGTGACTANSSDPAWLVALDGDPRFDGVQVEGPYDYDVLSERLVQGPELVEVLGFDRVETDQQAAYAIRASYEVEHSAFDVVEDEHAALIEAYTAQGVIEGEDPEFGVTIEPQAIVNGLASNTVREAVRFRLNNQAHCSAVVVSNRVILTAAHCLTVPALLGTNVVRGNRVTTMDITARTATGIDVTRYANGGTQLVRYARHPNYAGAGDRAHDIGMIILPTAMTGATTGRFFAPQRNGERADELHNLYTIRGWGIVNRTFFIRGRRRALFNAVAPAFWSHEELAAGVRSTTNAATCGGDSGSPWTVTAGSRVITIGVHSGSNGSSGFCTATWATMYGSAIGPKIGWMVSEAAIGGAALNCRLHGDSVGTRYYRCDY